MVEQGKIYNKIVILIVVYMILLYSVENSVIINWIGSNLWNAWVQPVSWLILILLLRYKVPRVHGTSKLTHQKVVSMWAFNCGVIYIIASILGGLLQGFGKSPYSHTPKGIMFNMIMMLTMLVGREFIRAYLLNSLARKENTLRIVGVVILMTITQITLASFTTVTDIKSLTILLAEKVLPILCQNILATYLVIYGGSISSIIYLGMIEIFMYLAPILPNMGWFGKGVIGIMVPSFALIMVSETYAKLTKTTKAYKSQGESVWSWVPTVILSISIIWFTVGVFPIYPSAIATGSMEPVIDPGDVVLMHKVKSREEINALQVGDVMQFKRGDLLIVHRILEIVEEEGQKVYRTKGDNNSVADSELVKAEDIKGELVKVIPKIGWPTLMFKSNNPDILEQVEF